MVKARAYSNPVPGMTFIHKSSAFKVVRWDDEIGLWECRACGFSSLEPTYYCDAMIRACAGMRIEK